MNCDSCGMLIFLKSNSRFWENPKLLDEIMLEEKLAAIENGVVEIDATDADGLLYRGVITTIHITSLWAF